MKKTIASIALLVLGCGSTAPTQTPPPQPTPITIIKEVTPEVCFKALDEVTILLVGLTEVLQQIKDQATFSIPAAPFAIEDVEQAQIDYNECKATADGP